MVDEAAFVSAATMVSVLPLLTVKGRKQIHITSPAPSGSWISQVAMIKTGDGKPFAQVIDVKYKCSAHASDPTVEGFRCPCNFIHLPDHIRSGSGYMKGMETLLNLVQPGAFKTELAGGTSEILGSATLPFESSFVNFLGNAYDKDDPRLTFKSPLMEKAVVVVAVDPTFSTGSTSCIGVCTAMHLVHKGMPQVVLLGVDAVNIANYAETSSKLHELIIRTHAMTARVLYPDLSTLVVIEANTYCESISNLWRSLKDWTREHSFRNFYCYYDRVKNPDCQYAGKTVGSDKISTIQNLAAAMDGLRIGRIDTLFSAGNHVLSSYAKQRECLGKQLGATTGTALASRLNAEPVQNFGQPLSASNPNHLMFALAQHIDMPQDSVMGTLFVDADAAVELLKTQMLRVQITLDRDGRPTLNTGGKKRQSGGYTKDDVLSALLLSWTVHPYVFAQQVRVE